MTLTGHLEERVYEESIECVGVERWGCYADLGVVVVLEEVSDWH